MAETAGKISLSRDQLKQILAAAKNSVAANEPEPEVEAVDYDWKRPHQYMDCHHTIFAQFNTKLAGDLSEEVSDICSDPSRVTIPKVKEYYADGLVKDFCEDKSNYYMNLRDENNVTVGALIIPYLSAIQWTAKILGDPADDVDENYEISNLEETMIIDLSNAMIKRLSESLKKQNLRSIESESILTNREWPVDCLGYDEFTVLELQVEHSDITIQAYFAVFSNVFGPMLDISFPEENQASTNEVRKAIIENLNSIPIDVDVMLGKANVAIADLMNIKEGDVIVLNRKAHEPVDALIEGKVFFHGIPAKTMKRYALSVVDMIEPGKKIK